MTLQISDNITPYSLKYILKLISERLVTTNILDIFKDKIFTNNTKYQYELKQFLNKIYENVIIIYRDFSFDGINKNYEYLLNLHSEKELTKFVFFWDKTNFIEDNEQYMAFANYPISSIIAGDDSLSQAFTLSIDFPILPFPISTINFK